MSLGLTGQRTHPLVSCPQTLGPLFFSDPFLLPMAHFEWPVPFSACLSRLHVIALHRVTQVVEAELKVIKTALCGPPNHALPCFCPQFVCSAAWSSD